MAYRRSRFRRRRPLTSFRRRRGYPVRRRRGYRRTYIRL